MHHPWSRSPSAGSRAEELLATLQGHLSHLKPELALRVAIHLLPDAEALLGSPSTLPQRVSNAIQVRFFYCNPPTAHQLPATRQ